MKHYSHGEVTIFETKELPKGAKKVKGDGKRYILADSENSGNHHCLEEKAGVDLYEKDGVLYLKNDVPVNVFCVDEARHDTITLEPSIWEIDKAKEFDYLEMMKRNVAD